MNSAKSPAKKSWLQTLIKNKSEREKVIFIFTSCSRAYLHPYL
ncbi:hypothetical protein [Priestia megaterium]